MENKKDMDFDVAVMSFKKALEITINNSGLPLTVIDMSMEEVQQQVKQRIKSKFVTKDGEKNG